MDPVHILFVAAVLLAILVVAAFLITVTYQLAQVISRLNTILGVVVDVGEKTSVLGPVINEIADDLAAGEKAVGDAVSRLQARKGVTPESGGDGAAGSTPEGPPPTTHVGTGFANY